MLNTRAELSSAAPIAKPSCPAISHDILEFSARVLTQWAVSFPNALDA